MLIDWKVGRTLTVNPNDVGLHRVGVGGGRNLTEKNWRSVNHLQRQMVKARHLAGTAIEFNAILAVANLNRSGGYDDVVVIERIADVLGGEPVSIHLRRVEVHHHGTIAAAKRRRHGNTLDGEQTLSDRVLPVIEKFLLREGVAEYVDLRYRDVSGVVVNDVRRSHAWREKR